MGQAMPQPTLRPFLPTDTPMLAAIFVASIAELTGDDYSETQQAAWANAAEDELPAYLAALSPDGGTVVALPPVAETVPPDERYEEAVIALIWQTGKLHGEAPYAD